MTRGTIRLLGDGFTFCACHQVVFTGHDGSGTPFPIIEPLHGHDFQVRFSLEGPVNQDRVVLDFISCGTLLKSLLSEYHHRILIPARSRWFCLVEEESTIRILAGTKEGESREWSFPAGDARVLDVENVTTEELAWQLLTRFRDLLVAKGLLTCNPGEYRLTLELEESRGVSAAVTLLGDEPAEGPTDSER